MRISDLISKWGLATPGERPLELRFRNWVEVNQFCARAGCMPPPSRPGATLDGVPVSIDVRIPKGEVEVVLPPV